MFRLEILMKINHKPAYLLLAFLLAFSLTACGNTAQAPSDSEESQEAVPSQEVSESVSEESSSSFESLEEEPAEPLTQEEEASLTDLVDQVAKLPVGTAGSTLSGYELFCHLANDFAFYADKSEEADRILMDQAEKVESKEEFQVQLDVLASNLMDMDMNLESLQTKVQDAGVKLEPTLKASQIEGMIKAMMEGAGLNEGEVEEASQE